jgi:hypothetical protein
VWDGKWDGTGRDAKSRKSLLLRITGAKPSARALNPAIAFNQIVTTSLPHQIFVVGQSSTNRRRGANRRVSCIPRHLITEQTVEILVDPLPRFYPLDESSVLSFGEWRVG